MKSNTVDNVKQKRIKRILQVLVFILVCVGIVYAIGFLAGTYFKDYIKTHIASSSKLLTMVRIYGLIIIFFFSFLIHIIIHETGHLIFGLLTGYSFVSFRVGSHAFIKEDGKLRYKRFSLPGTGGQCLLMPPPQKSGTYPFVLYNLGGIIMNAMTVAAALFVVIFMNDVTYPIDTILFLFSLGGIYSIIINGIPMKLSGIPNDAHNVLSIARDMEARNAFHTQLTVNGLLSQGNRIKDFPLEMFKLRENSDLCNPLNTGTRLFEYYWYLDNMTLEMAKECIETLTPYYSKLPQYYRQLINCERIFLELVGNCDKSFIDSLYDDSLKKYIKVSKFMLGRYRLLMAYEGFYNGDREKALEHYEAAKQIAKKYPVKGDAEMELMLMDWIKERLKI
ncbi:hypothetical protein [Clostridium thermarum]|uniref:hypothetical protein n=1 Tax=Clostridium thermarum TaxID=1716543 RepID=UPI001123517C|nr:hypothetical protein [Clostridium thermarum]